jgi:hypothetical protein
MSDPTATYLYERSMLHKRNAEKLLSSPALNGQEVVSELMSMVHYLELGMAKQRRESDTPCSECGFYEWDSDSAPLKNCQTCGRERNDFLHTV